MEGESARGVRRLLLGRMWEPRAKKKATGALKIVVQLLKKLVYYRLTRTSNVVNRSLMWFVVDASEMR
jgi:hypothetical protein